MDIFTSSSERSASPITRKPQDQRHDLVQHFSTSSGNCEGTSAEVSLQLLELDRVPPPPRRAPAAGAPAPSAALECVHAQGGEPRRLGPEARAVLLTEGEALEVGRQHQPGFFEALLKAEPQWLGDISRAHLSVRLSHVSVGDGRATPPRGGTTPSLKVENLSANVVLVNGHQLAKGQSECISEGDTLAFVAKPPHSAETEFLRFVLRRARGRANLR